MTETTFPFEIHERYGSKCVRLDGGQGFVYVCDDLYLDRKVAIKILKVGTNEQVLLSEIAAISSIASKHVVQLYDIVTSKGTGRIGVVQEFVPGESLASFRNTCTPERFLFVLWQIAKGLTDIHLCDHIHRDIKPHNMRFDAEGVVKILDFGLASPVGDADTLRGRGTPGFRAPEYYQESVVSLTQAVDVYAFGVTAWWLGCGGSLPASLKQIPPLSTLEGPRFEDCGIPLPAEVKEILNRTLHRQREARPTMKEVLEVLESRLLYGKHSAYILAATSGPFLKKPGSTVNLKAGQNAIAVSYDGMKFYVSGISGNAYVNNRAVAVGEQLPRSCVVTLGPPELGASRTFVPIDMSHPGLTI